MKYFKWLLFALFFVAAMTFVMQNNAELNKTLKLGMSVRTWQWTTGDIPFYFLMLASFFVAAVLSAFYFLGDKLRMGCQVKEHKAVAARLERENQDLKAKVESLQTSLSSMTASSTTSYGSSYSSGSSTTVAEKPADENEVAG